MKTYKKIKSYLTSATIQKIQITMMIQIPYGLSAFVGFVGLKAKLFSLNVL